MANLVDKTVLMDSQGISRALVRISHEIVEKNKGVDNILLVGIRSRGVPLSERVADAIEKIEKIWEKVCHKGYAGIMGIDRYENGECDGLGFIDGEVKLLEPKEKAKIPHIGWNRLEYNSKNDLIKGLDENSFVYYVHSYAATNVKDENLIGFSNYGGIKVPSIVCNDNIYGTQFHPEKSGEVGLRILKNFGEVIK